ncbi:MAG: hypothetical protein AB7V26_08440 [Lysobacterales bacterium]
MPEMSDETLDALLRRDFEGAVVDDGFSARVMRALPPRRRSRPWLLPGAVLAGGLLAWLALLPSPLLQLVAREWQGGGFTAASIGVCLLLLVVSVLGCGWALDEG